MKPEGILSFIEKMASYFHAALKDFNTKQIYFSPNITQPMLSGKS